MKQLTFLTLTLFAMFISNSIFGQSLTAFKASVEESGMSLNIPAGYIESKIVDNKDMGYEYALKYPDKDFEIRYAIRPIKLKVYPNDSVKKAMEAKSALRNSTCEKNLKNMIYNLTGGVVYEIKAFAKDAVKDEFNADWGAILLIELKSDFGKGYKYCMVVAIHKDDVADAYYFYLAKNKDNYPENMKPFFHSLRFD